MTARQLSFDLPAIPALGRDDFYVSRSNAQAVALVEAWRNWPEGKLVIAGPHGAGKTHLAHVWAELSGARILRAADLHTSVLPDLATRALAVEDADAIAGENGGERALLHLHNMMQAERLPLLLTASLPPNRWSPVLADLASRLQAIPTAALQPPDDSLLAAVMMKLMSDRQLSPTPDTIPYLTRRIDRSFESAHRVVEALDRLSLETRRPINRVLAARVLDKTTP